MENAKLVKVGYIVSFCSLLVLPVVTGSVGVMIGFINLKRGEVKHGVLQIIIAFVCALLGSYFGSVVYKYFLAR
jgi:hypothetical protein